MATAARSSSIPSTHSIAAKRDRTVGQGPGLVEADDVDAGQPLDGGELLHEHLAPGQAQRADEEGDAREQHQALRHHPHEGGHRADHRVGGALVAPGQLADEEDRSDDDEAPADVAQQGVDALHQLRAGLREALRLGGQPLGVGVGPDGGRLEAAGAGDDDRAGQHLGPRSLVDGVRLAGQERLVDLQAVRGDAPDRRRAPGRPPAAAPGRRAPPRRPRAPVLRRRAPPSPRGAFRTARRSRVRLARSSWMMPMAAFQTMTRPKSASAGDPTTSTATNSTPRMALKRVRTLARMMAESGRLVCSSTRLTWPAATRSATCAAVSPVAGVDEAAASLTNG